MKEIKFIYWFAYYNEDSPSVRYRATYPLEFCKKHYGIKSILVIPGYQPKLLFRFVNAYLSALFFRKKQSVIVIQRVHSKFIYSSLLKVLVRVRPNNTVYDLDDADYLYLRPNNIYWFARNCNYISAGSRAIIDHLSPLNSNIIFTTSPTPDLGLFKSAKNKRFTIGWVGLFGGDHKESLIEQIFPAVRALKVNCRLTLLGVTNRNDLNFIQDYFKQNPCIELEIPLFIDWRDEASIQRKILTFDIGIATLNNNPIQLAKSGIKAKQYLNNGVPVLATNLPENDWLIRNGENGYLCNSGEDFHQRIIEFIEMDLKTYTRFSIAARASIHEFNHVQFFSQFDKISLLN